MKNALSTTWLLVPATLLLILMYGCKKTDIQVKVYDDVNITGYLDKNLDSFSLFRQILERTETSAYLNAYGAYTCFAPTNSGVQTYLTKIGATSVEAADLNTLKDMVSFHLIGDTLTTGSFTDGKIRTATMYGQYLTATVATYNGQARYLINKQAFITTPDIRVGNGYVHVINNVLVPAKLTLAKTLEANSNYSVFVQALRETGFLALLDSVNNPDPNKKWLTVLAESNQALADSGITSYAQLKARYSQTGNPALPNDSLHLYCAYHILSGIKFLGDIIIAPSHITLAPQEVVSTKLDNQQRVLINDDIFNGVAEPGIELRRSASDIASSNGVIHDAKSHFTLKYRKPTAVFWDVSNFDEIRKLTAYFRRQDYTFTRATEADQPIKDITWQFAGSGNTLTYSYSTTISTSNFACNNDVNTTGMGGGRPTEISYRTPAIIKGRYKVWICYRGRQGSSNSDIQCSVIIDSTQLQRTFAFTSSRPSGTDADLEAINYKRYTENTSTSWAGRLVGIVDIQTTERHVLKIKVVSGANSTCHLDMIHFIPVNENQILPRFKPNGDKIYY